MIEITESEIASTIHRVEHDIHDGNVQKDSTYQAMAHQIILMIREKEIKILEKSLKDRT